VTVKLPLGELAARIGARIKAGFEREHAREVTGVGAIEDADPGQLTFYANARYKKELLASRAAAVLVSEEDAALVPADAVPLVAAQPYVAFAKASALFHPEPRAAPGIQPGAHVHPQAQVAASASIGPGAVVGRGARIGEGTVLHPGALVLEDARVGAGCTLHAGAIVRERCLVGDRVVLQPGAVVGSDGFGFAFDVEGDENSPGPLHRKVPQAGIARIEDDVELGACSCVDRATLGETVIGRGSKIDNLVQVGHNVQVGPLSLIVAQAGISGSTTLGQGVVVAGQVGIVGHLRIGDGARLGAQAGVAHDVPDGETWTGYPAMPHREWLRMVSSLPRVPDLLRQVRALEKRLAELEARLPGPQP
jgi:UDP-3-O-[3-hydroxymyristoyl] glucosamine N-acyltransferase